MKLNRQLLKINRNFIICFICSASISAAVAQTLSDTESYFNTSITVAVGYAVFFGVFSSLFYLDNRKRFSQMKSKSIKSELIKLISSLGVAEVIYFAIRWSTQFYFLEINIEPYLASLFSEIIASSCYMTIVSVFLKATKTY